MCEREANGEAERPVGRAREERPLTELWPVGCALPVP